eukprot:6586244-Pyramimonas_sp.AAC.1
MNRVPAVTSLGYYPHIARAPPLVPPTLLVYHPGLPLLLLFCIVNHRDRHSLQPPAPRVDFREGANHSQVEV